MTRRLLWVLAAPLLTIAVAASTTYACAIWAAEHVLDADPFGDRDD